MHAFTQERMNMSDSNDDVHRQRYARQLLEDRAFEDLTVLRTRQRKEFLDKMLQGDDMAAWLAPSECAPSDEVLSEHMAQLRTAVRYAMQFALADDMTFERNMAAANAATRMIQANIALAKVLNAANAKTVRGVSRRVESQD